MFDMFRENAGLQANRIEYVPFHSDGERAFLLRVGQPRSLNKSIRRRKLLKIREKSTVGAKLEIFSTTITETMGAAANPLGFPRQHSDWSKTATSEQVRTLFFRLAIVMANRKLLNPIYLSSDAKFQALQAFQSAKTLFTKMDVQIYRLGQNQADERRVKTLRQRGQRDFRRLMLAETHAAAVALNQQLSTFTINANPEGEAICNAIVDDVGETPKKLVKRPAGQQRPVTYAHPLLAPIGK
jgi:hypothetical protein